MLTSKNIARITEGNVGNFTTVVCNIHL